MQDDDFGKELHPNIKDTDSSGLALVFKSFMFGVAIAIVYLLVS